MNIYYITAGLFLMVFYWRYTVGSERFSAHIFKRQNAIICKKLTTEQSCQSLPACSHRCLVNKKCQGILFDADAGSSDKCKLLTSVVTKRNNDSKLEHYVHYSVKSGLQKKCKNLGLSVQTPVNWGSKCPRLYFPLDSMSEGTAVGPQATSIVFTSGLVNNAFNFPNPAGNMQAYFSLGYYPSTSYCFPDPERCPEGATFAFWLKIMGSIEQFQGFITTARKEGPGFRVFLDDDNTGNDDNLIFQVKRDSDSITEMVGLELDDFISIFGFGTWVHYAISYKFESHTAGSNVNMEIYFNGEVLPKAWKWTEPWSEANLHDYDGDLELGVFELGNYWWATGNMMLDDLIIWEVQLPCDDAYRLYQAYNV